MQTALSLALSGAIHAALLAWGVVDVPEFTDAPRFPDRSAPLAADAEAAAPLIQVIRIRPPGVLPSGQAAGAAGSARAGLAPPTSPPAHGVSAPQPVPPALTLGASVPMTGLMLAAAEPTIAMVPLPTARTSGRPTRGPARPNRGVLRREEEPASGRSGSAGGVRAGSGTVGLGTGGSGVTTVGRGGDCITPGLGSPGRLGPLGGSLTNDRRRTGPGAAGQGRIGRGRP